MCISAKKRRAAARVSVEAVVAATEGAEKKNVSTPRVCNDSPTRTRVGSITLAALALPGVVATSAAQVTPLEEGVVSIKVNAYQDRQPGLERIRAISPGLYLALPVASQWSFEASLVYDDVSGASPRWHSAISSASRMSDYRKAGTAKITRSFERFSIALGGAYSDETDFRSRALSTEFRVASDDNNRTWSLALAQTDDAIHPVNEIVLNESRRTRDVAIGVTQNWSKNDVVQLNASYSRGRGYYSDSYKVIDRRPRERDQSSVLLRWNHHFESSGDTLRSAWRFYRDTFGVRAHTFDVAYAKPFGERFVVTPSLRYHTQNAADFYYDPVYDPIIGEPFPVGNPRFASPDHRLSAFGAITIGARLDWRIDQQWSADLKLEAYEQRSSWRLGGGGSPGLAPLRATIAQIGLTRRF
jgi:Protein of unknown function (DUF3570)